MPSRSITRNATSMQKHPQAPLTRGGMGEFDRTDTQEPEYRPGG